MILFMTLASVQAQQVSSQYYEVGDGLTSNLVESIVQDEAGFLWISTDDALVRFDGRNFSEVKTTIPASDFGELFIDQDQILWAPSNRGVFTIDLKRQPPVAVLNWPLDTLNQTEFSSPEAVFQDSKGRFWITESNSVSRVFEDTFIRYSFPKETFDDLRNRAFHSFEHPVLGVLVAVHSGRLYRYQRATDSFVELPVTIPGYGFNINDLMIASGVLFVTGDTGVYRLEIGERGDGNWDRLADIRRGSAIWCISDRIVFVGTRGHGNYRLQDFGAKGWQVQEFNPVHSSTLDVNSLSVDREGNLWIASTEGISLIQPMRFGSLGYPQTYQYTHTLELEDDGNVYAASEYSIFQIDPENEPFQVRRRITTKDHGYLTSLEKVGSRLWAGTTEGKILAIDGSRIQSVKLPQYGSRLPRHVLEIAADADDNLWIIQSTVNGVLRRSAQRQLTYFGPDQGLDVELSDIEISAEGEVYAGALTGNHPLYRLAGNEFVPVGNVGEGNLEGALVQDMRFDGRGDLWMVTTNGLMVYRPSEGSFEQLDAIRNLRGEFGRSIVSIDGNYVWIGTKQGLWLYDVATSATTRFDRTSGLPHLVNSFRSAALDKKGRLWLGTDKGIAYLRLPFDYTSRTAKPVITNITIDGEPVSFNAESLSFDEGDLLTFSFQALSFPNNKVEFRSRLIGRGEEQEWSEWSDARDLTYTSLPQGRFVLEVQAKQLSKAASPAVVRPFTISPPWYRTPIAWGIYSTLFVVAIILIGTYLQNVRRQRTFQKQLLESEMRLDMVAANLPIVLFALDNDGIFTLAIGRGMEKQGFISEYLVGKSYKTHYPSEYHNYIEEAYSGIPIKYKRETNGTYFETMLLPAYGEGGHRNGIIGVSIDVTSHELAEQALKTARDEAEQARQQAEAANKAKSDFLANMSHELRTPLNAIIGFAQILSKDTQMNPRNREHVQIMQKSGEHLLSMINDILDLSKIEAGHIESHLVNFSLDMLLNDIKNMFRIQAENKGIELRFDIDPDLPKFLNGDQSKTRQILINLTSNAIKYTDQGYVRFSAYRIKKSDSDDRAWIAFRIEDTGQGIRPEDKARIFAPFEQVKGDQSKGTGLGLSITDRLIGFLGGEIALESEVGKGSIFTVQLPFTIQQTNDDFYKAFDQENVITGIKGDVQPHVLVVDDIKVNCDVLTSMLEGVGYRCSVARNGLEAITFMETEVPDIVLLDIVMPVMNGIEAMENIRSHEEWKALPLVAVTASGFDRREVELLERGFDRFIRKPFKDEVLYMTLADLLSVEYNYAEDDDIGSVSTPGLSAKQIAAEIGDLDNGLRKNLMSAIELTDLDALKSVVDHLSEGSPTRKRLEQAIDDHDYHFILTLSEQLNP